MLNIRTIYALKINAQKQKQSREVKIRTTSGPSSALTMAHAVSRASDVRLCVSYINIISVLIFMTIRMGFRDWSLITGRGGATKGEGGGHVKFYPYEKGGQKKF